MKLNDLLSANDALNRLAEKRLSSYKKMRDFVKLCKVVEQEVAFYASEEKKAVDAYAQVDDNGSPIFLGDGRIRLKDATSKQAFEKEISALRDTEIDDIEPLFLSENDFRSIDDLPTANDMMALEGIVIFED